MLRKYNWKKVFLVDIGVLCVGATISWLIPYAWFSIPACLLVGWYIGWLIPLGWFRKKEAK